MLSKLILICFIAALSFFALFFIIAYGGKAIIDSMSKKFNSKTKESE